MLKPRDIANVEFRTAWRGYNQDDVDQFMKKILGAYEDLYQQNLRLQEQTGELKRRLEEYSKAETHIDETLALARQTSADVKAAAEERARAIVAEAKVRAEQIVGQARREAERHLARVQELTRQERTFRERFRDLLESYWALLEEERREAEQLTKTFINVAGEVASARDGDDDVSSPNPGGPFFDDDLDSDVDLVDDGGVSDDEGWATRRMEAVDGENDR